MSANQKITVAILGATSHIAKWLITVFAKRQGCKLLLYARSPERVEDFLSLTGCSAHVFPIDDFGQLESDVVINYVGIADPGRLKNESHLIFRLIETWDNRVLEYLDRYPDTLYIHLSSGAAYGIDFSRPVEKDSQSDFPLNALSPSEFYGIAKLNAEAKHRAAKERNIVDLRVFSYFSRFIDLSTRFLLTDILTSLKVKTELLTTAGNIVRDYVHPDDLTALIELCINRRRLNGVFDVYSKKPVTKFEILDDFAARYGLKYRVADESGAVIATGTKDNYYSLNHCAEELGYMPRHTSLESLRSEIDAILAEGR